MLSALLQSTRRLNKIIQGSGPDGVIFSDLTRVLSEILICNVHVASRKGRVLGSGITKQSSRLPYENNQSDDSRFTDDYNERLLKITESKPNIKSGEYLNTIIPVICVGDRLGTLIFESDREFDDSDLILAEYSATVVGMEIMRAKTEEIEEEARKKAVVQMAIGTLSYSEFEAVDHIFRELDGSEGLLVASKIADRVGITRSVIVNALRKFESAGVIESRSLGMKGTHIKILNDKLLPELEKAK